MHIKSHTAIVTGGGSGMGAATVRALAQAGAKVVLWDMNLEAAEKVATETGGVAIKCDVTDEASVNAALDQSPQPRALVHCAGILIGKRILAKEGVADLAHFQKVVAVNLTGAFNVLRLTAARMSVLDPLDADGSRGVIINAASIAAFEGQVGQAAYAASKGGIVSMTLPAARELARFGIRVMAIAPGMVQTPMIGAVSDELQKSIESGIPFPSRFAKPEEFAKLALHIIDNDMLNGEVIRLDGAARLAAK